MNNIAKHSGATKARLEMLKGRKHLMIEAQDNRKGFQESDSPGTGIGLKTIRDRVKLLGVRGKGGD